MKTLYLKLTTNCNLRCKHCYLEKHCYNNSKDIVFDKSLNFNDYDNIVLHGGEPTLYKDINLLLKYVSQYSKKVDFSITTNLCYQLSDKLIKLFQYIKSINVSFDLYLRNYSKEQINLILNNIKILKSYNLEVGINVCLDKDIIKNYEPKYFYELCKEYKLNFIQFERLVKLGNAKKNDIHPKATDLNNWIYKSYFQYKDYVNNFENVLLYKLLGHIVKGYTFMCKSDSCSVDSYIYDNNGLKQGCIVYSENDSIIHRKLADCCLKCSLYYFCKGDCKIYSYDSCRSSKELYKYIEKHIEEKEFIKKICDKVEK